MPDNELEVSCPGCDAIFNVPAELAGEVAECSECGAVFEIPKQEEVEQEPGTETGAIKGKVTEESETATNTVKLSRTSIGMIPNLKNTFTFGEPAKPVPPAAPSLPRPGSGPTFAPPPQPAPQQAQRPAFTAPTPPPQQQQAPKTAAPASFPIPPAQPSAAAPQQGPPVESPQFKTQMTGHAAPPPAPVPTAPPPVSTPPPRPPSASAPGGQKMSFKKPGPPTAPSAAPQTQGSAPSAAAPSQSVQLPPWTRIQLRPDEQVYGFREIATNPVGVAIGASCPVLICLAAVFLAKEDAIISYAIVGGVWLASFVTIAAIAAKSKTFIAFTSARVIFISGFKRIELNK